MRFDRLFMQAVAAVMLASTALAVCALVCPTLAVHLVRSMARFRLELAMIFITLAGTLVYGAVLVAALQASGVRVLAFLPPLRLRPPSLRQLAKAASTRAHERAPL